MASANQIKALLKSHIDGDDPQFFAVAMQVAAAEARKGHANVAHELRELIDKARASNKTVAPAIPLARPREELADLLSVSYPKIRVSNLVLSVELRGRIENLLKEQRNFNKLKAHGLQPCRKLLLTGPPGCGKTMSASALAGELGLPLFVVRLDGLITKYMGESIAKLRLIFDAIQQTRAVYLFDEFDSIGMQRGFANDVGEIKRVLKSFLMFIEQDASNSLIIAATNHPQILDHALFRRFDEILEFTPPTPDLIREAVRNRLVGIKTDKLKWEDIQKAAEGLSFADIVRACDESAKKAILDDDALITTDSLNAALESRSRFNKKIQAGS